MGVGVKLPFAIFGQVVGKNVVLCLENTACSGFILVSLGLVVVVLIREHLSIGGFHKKSQSLAPRISPVRD